MFKSINLSVSIWVDSKNTGGAIPLSYACFQRKAHKHQRSPGFTPENWNSGCGVDKSLPTDLLNSKNSSVAKMHTVCTPISSLQVSHEPFLKKPVFGLLQQTSSLLPNTFILKDMDKAVNRTFQAIINKEITGIFGDYDVDGATSTAILGNYFNEINHEIQIYIPDRKTEGYGPSINGFEKLISKGAKLIFTVDCGTLSFETIDFFKKKNTDVLVFDHHQSELKLPITVSILNLNRF